MEEKFTWIPIYKEIADKLATFSDNRKELLEFLQEMNREVSNVMSLIDKVGKKEFNLEDIDPFTFFANFNREIKNRQKIIEHIKERWSLSSEIPDDFSGIPIQNKLNVWFFSYKPYRNVDDIDLLWDLFKAARTDNPVKEIEKFFDKCLQIKQVGFANLAQGLFWILPETFFPVNSKTRPFLKTIKINENYKGYIEILDYIKRKYKNQKLYELSHEMWKDNKDSKESPEKELNVWLYAPGEGARKWDEFYKKGIMAISWDDLGRLDKYKSKKQINEKLKDIYQFDQEPIMSTLACFEFYNTIKVGDIVIPKKGQRLYIGYGIVQSDYFFDDKAKEYKHRRKVKWYKKGEWKETAGPIVTKTLTNINKYPDYVKKVFRLIGIESNETARELISNLEGKAQKMSQELQIPLNQILYGPPGTGKTWSIKTEYIPMFKGEKEELSDVDFIEKQVGKYTWFQIIAAALLERNEVTVAELMNHDLVKAKIRSSSSRKPDATIWGVLQTHTILECEHTKVANRQEPLVFYKSEKSVWSIKKDLAENSIPGIINLGGKIRQREGTEDAVERFKFTTFHQSYSYEEFIEGLKPVTGQSENEITYEIVDGTFKKCCQEALKLTHFEGKWEEFFELTPEERKKYFNEQTPSFAIFIDEINRGNISKIFGELITLVEDDKRLGSENEIITELPYSKEKFGVPKNLYIIGTMNSADRSIALIDTALRRRFNFKEMMPDLSQFESLQVKGINIQLLLKNMNQKIGFLYDRDHTIGHSYFMPLKDDQSFELLCEIFAYKIIPLLQEYFYDDFEKIQLVFFDHFAQLKMGAEADKMEEDPNSYRLIQSMVLEENKIIGFDHPDYEDSVTYRINPGLATGKIDVKAFIKIYEPKILEKSKTDEPAEIEQ